MKILCSDVLAALKDRTLVTAESCTGGGIGAALTAVPGASANFKGGIICYTNWVKSQILGVPCGMIEANGPVSASVAKAMAAGARKTLDADVAVSVTGLAGPGGDEYGNTAGTVHIGYCDQELSISREYHFDGDRNEVRKQACRAALLLVLECLMDH